MDLAQYFENKKGTGVLATADDQCRVDLAVYARPHVIVHCICDVSLNSLIISEFGL
jgi:hypothetical protein